MYEKLTDAFKLAKIFFKHLIALFEMLGLNVPYDMIKEVDDMADDALETGIPAKYID
ncbi:MAG: hypothetical protein IKN72_12315 [Clostridia bacterium]|nr:hypothetical protein [Clostridia bacterium]